MSKLSAGISAGLLAGAAGATALNVVTYARQALQGTPTTATPDQTANAVVEAVGLEVPGDPETRANRLEGMGPLAGYGVGLGFGVIGGVLRARGVKVPFWAASAALGLGAMTTSDSVMTALGITDPRSWSASTVVQDAAPHLVYGAVTVAALHKMIDPRTFFKL